MSDRVTTAAAVGMASHGMNEHACVLKNPHRLCAHRPLPHHCANESRTSPEQTFRDSIVRNEKYDGTAPAMRRARGEADAS